MKRPDAKAIVSECLEAQDRDSSDQLTARDRELQERDEHAERRFFSRGAGQRERWDAECEHVLEISEVMS